MYCFLGKFFKKVSDVIGPYARQAGELIMRIAQPLLETKVGRGLVKGTKLLGELGYLMLDMAEYVIEAPSKLINSIREKTTELFNWIADRACVKKVTERVKKKVAWVTSTSVFKWAVNTAVNVFTKMSNFCTAVVESYRYYNQCRTIARRIVNEKTNLVDEHALIKTFQSVSMAETKNAEQNQETDDVGLKKKKTKIHLVKL